MTELQSSLETDATTPDVSFDLDARVGHLYTPIQTTLSSLENDGITVFIRKNHETQQAKMRLFEGIDGGYELHVTSVDNASRHAWIWCDKLGETLRIINKQTFSQSQRKGFMTAATSVLAEYAIAIGCTELSGSISVENVFAQKSQEAIIPLQPGREYQTTYKQVGSTYEAVTRLVTKKGALSGALGRLTRRQK